MYYHSPQFQNIADQAAAYIKPLILQTIRELAADFVQQFPNVTRINASTGNIMLLNAAGEIERTGISKTLKNPLYLFLRDITTKDLIGFCPDITLQPAVLVDGVPIEEAIKNALPKTFVVMQSSGQGDDYTRQTLYAGNDYEKAKAIAVTTQGIENMQFQTDVRQDLEHWQNGECTEVEEYLPKLPQIKCNQCEWTGDEEDLKPFEDEDGHGQGCPHCKTDSYLKNLYPH